MQTIYKDLFQSTEMLEGIPLSIHLYFLNSEDSVLIQTGSVSQAKATLPSLKKVLGGRELQYILVSHFESDECGGLSVILEEYPNAVVVCSEVTARQIAGFGIGGTCYVMKGGETLKGKGFTLQSISYPSEMHLWEGLLFFEVERGILFSSDLMFQMGDTHGKVVESSWKDALKQSGVQELPQTEMRQTMEDALKDLKPAFVASGHGACLSIID